MGEVLLIFYWMQFSLSITLRNSHILPLFSACRPKHISKKLAFLVNTAGRSTVTSGFASSTALSAHAGRAN